MKEVIIKLPTPPARANKSRGWMQYDGFHKKAYFKECEAWLRATKRPKEPWQYIGWRAHVEVARDNDFDNLVARLKWAIDALKEFGFLTDDSPKHCWPLGFPSQSVVGKRDAQRFVTLTIEIYDEAPR